METAKHPLLKISHQLGQGKRQWLLAPPLRAWVVLTLLPSPTKTFLSLPCNLAGYGRLAALQSQEDIVQRKGCRLALGKNFQPAWEKRGRVVCFHHLQGLGLGGSILPRIQGHPAFGRASAAQEPWKSLPQNKAWNPLTLCVVCSLVGSSKRPWLGLRRLGFEC